MLCCSTERTRSKALQLEQKFTELLTDTQTLFSSKESENPQFFKSVQYYLINCQLSPKLKCISVLYQEKTRIREAANLQELFKILHSYLNWINYDLLQFLVEKFGDDALKWQLKNYLSELDIFEGDTFITDFEEVIITEHVEAYHIEVEINLQRNLRQLTFLDIRNLKQDIESCVAITKSAGMIKSVISNSVSIVFLYPRLALELLPPAMDKNFRTSHDIISITIRHQHWRRPLEDINVQVSVSIRDTVVQNESHKHVMKQYCML